MICRKCKTILPDEWDFCPLCGRPQKQQPRKGRRRPNGFGSIYKLPGNRKAPWTAVIGGEYLGYWETEMEAQAYLNSWVQRQTTAAANYTLGQIRDRWMESKRYKKLSKDAKNNYAAAWKRLKPQENKKMRTLKTPDYQKAIQLAVNDGVGYEGCNKIRSLVSVLCQEAMKDDVILQNYAHGLELPDAVKTPRENFTYDDILKLFYADEDRDARIVLCIIYTGARGGELFSVLKANVHLDEGYMVGGFKTDAGTNRIIPIRSEILPYIRGFMLEPGEYLITSATGKKVDRNNFAKRNFYPLLDRLEISYKDADGKHLITLNRGRHTFLEEAIRAGAAPEALIKIAGHTKYSTTIAHYFDKADLEYLKKEGQKGL